MSEFARAALFDGPQRPFRVVQLPISEIGEGEILVRIVCCTICGSDIHTVAGRRTEPTPCILGHEIVGRIVRLGIGSPKIDLHGEPLCVGDRVTWTSCASCGKCYFCTHELPQKCERIFKYGHQAIDDGHPLGGGFADHCILLPGTGVVRIPDDLPDATACPANCATATVAAVLRTAGGCRGKTVLVQGAGMLGLTACAMASAGVASTVICTDINPMRLEQSLCFGATAAVEPAGLRSAINGATSGRGVDLALEFSGSVQAMSDGLEVLRIGGTAVWAGAVYPVPPLPIKPEAIIRRWLTIRGVHNYVPADLLAAIDFLRENHRRFPFAELVAAAYPLSEIDHAFREAQASGAVRIAVRPES